MKFGICYADCGAIAPKTTHSPVVYPIAVLKRSKDANVAKEFEQFLSSSQAKPIFEKQGFTLAAGS